jgi:hypothetical protein
MSVIVSTGGVPTQYPAVTLVDSSGAAYNPATDIPVGTFPVTVSQNKIPGRYYGNPVASVTTFPEANNNLILTPWRFETSISIDRIAIDVTTGGTVGSVTRLGVYADNNGIPGTLLIDAGTVDSTSTGVKELTIALTLAPGLYYFASASQGAPATQPTIRVGAPLISAGSTVAATVLANLAVVNISGGVTGAFVSSPAISSASTLGTRFAIRVAS